jgi:hypothetical protein
MKYQNLLFISSFSFIFSSLQILPVLSLTSNSAILGASPARQWNWVSSFPNQLSSKLQAELADAKKLGVRPLNVQTQIKTAAFDSVISAGTIKWAIDEAGNLLIIPKNVGGSEIYHSVLTNGAPVAAAGEAEMAGDKTNGYFLLMISNYSGHYKPTGDTIDLGIAAFKKAGVKTDSAKKVVQDPKKYS